MDKKIKEMMRIRPYEIREEMTDLNSITPYGVSMIKAPEFWNVSNGGQGINIAVIDTGCDIYHPNLQDRIIGGRNFTDDDNGNTSIYLDYNGHGTHVAGIIAASRDSGAVVGVAPEANLLILKALNGEGAGEYKWIINAINYAITQKVDIISMSLGGSEDVPQLHDAVKRAVSNGILVVCAAGNDGDGNYSTIELSYPAAYNEVISVGAIDDKLTPAWFSENNNEVDIMAPGVGIISTFPENRYAKLDGTSMAAPHITGALALLINWSKNEFQRNLTESEVYAQLVKSTVTIDAPRIIQGNGVIQLTQEKNLIKPQVKKEDKQTKNKKSKPKKVKKSKKHPKSEKMSIYL